MLTCVRHKGAVTLVLGTGILAAAAGCSKSCPLPAELDGAFAKGTVCMPTNAPTGSASVRVPIRFDLCLLSCLSIVPRSPSMTYVWQCAGPACEMVLVAAARLAKDPKKECDGCLLEDPPTDQCTPQSVSFDFEPPFTIDPATGARSYQAQTFTVRIPYLTLEQAAAVQADLRAGKDVSQSLAAIGGGGRDPGRAFTVTFDPANPPAPAAAALGGADCHAISLP